MITRNIFQIQNQIGIKKTFEIKLNNIIKVLNDLDADIIALQEIESKELMKLLLKKNTKI